MSKSLRRVKAALAELGLEDTICETSGATTAQMATDAVGCDMDQIGKSIIFQIGASNQVVLFITAGGQQVDRRKSEVIVRETLTKADAALIRATTGFAIGVYHPWVIKYPAPYILMKHCLNTMKFGLRRAHRTTFSGSHLTYFHKKYPHKYLIL